MGVVRGIGRVFVILGLAALGLGVWLWLSGRDLALAAGQIWYELDKASLNLVQAVVQRYIHPAVWDSAFVPWLLLPGWRAIAILVVGFGVVGGLLLLAASRRPRRAFRR